MIIRVERLAVGAGHNEACSNQDEGEQGENVAHHGETSCPSENVAHVALLIMR